MMMKPIRLTVIEDNSNYLKSLTTALYLLEDIQHIDTFQSCEAFNEAFDPSAPRPDCMLLDLNLPGLSGIDALPLFKQQLPKTEIIMLTQSDDYRHVLKAIHLGASGYMIKGCDIKKIVQTIREVLSGASVIDPKLSRIVLNTLTKQSQTATAPGISLSPREVEVLSLMADGKTKKEVADDLNLSYHAIDLYTRNVYEKLKAPNIASAIAIAIRRNLI